MKQGFEGSYLGDEAKLTATSRLECKVCWYLYDPAKGDEAWQIPSGTPFYDLPEHWTCPNCGNSADQFLLLFDQAQEGESPFTPNPTKTLEAAFAQIENERMQGLPFLNEQLEVEAIGFDGFQQFWLGIVLTPWTMNLLLLPRDEKQWPKLNKGEKYQLVLPAGQYEFIMAHEALFGAYMMCPLFSPVQQFADHQTARQTAQYILEAIFREDIDQLVIDESSPEHPVFKAQEAKEAEISKRDFLRGRFSGQKVVE